MRTYCFGKAYTCPSHPYVTFLQCRFAKPKRFGDWNVYFDEVSNKLEVEIHKDLQLVTLKSFIDHKLFHGCLFRHWCSSCLLREIHSRYESDPNQVRLVQQMIVSSRDVFDNLFGLITKAKSHVLDLMAQ